MGAAVLRYKDPATDGGHGDWSPFLQGSSWCTADLGIHDNTLTIAKGLQDKVHTTTLITLCLSFSLCRLTCLILPSPRILPKINARGRKVFGGN